MSRNNKKNFYLYHQNQICLVLIIVFLVSCANTSNTSSQEVDNSQDTIRFQISKEFQLKLEESRIPLEDFLPKDCNSIESISTFSTRHKPDFKISKKLNKRDIYYDKNRMLIRVGSRSAACPDFFTEMGVINDSLFIVTKKSMFINAIMTFDYKVEYSIIDKGQINTIKIYGYSNSDTLTYSLDTIPEVENISTVIDSLKQNSLYHIDLSYR